MTTNQPLSLFISSKMDELAEERRAVQIALNAYHMSGWLWEDDAGARPEPIRSTYLKEVEDCDLYLGLFWLGYGRYTIEEYQHARKHQKPCLVYEKHVELEQRNPELATFLQDIGRVENPVGLTIRRFQTAKELAKYVQEDVLRLLATVFRKSRQQPPAPQIWNVPYRRNFFFTGRETLLTDLHTRLSTSKAAALTQAQAISGLGGIGKTQTAVEYAYRYQAEYQAVLWAGASTPLSLLTDFVKLAAVLNLPEQDAQDQQRTVAAVKRWLETQTAWLLILDNVDDVPMAANFLPLRGNGHVLLTTRAQTIGPLGQSIEVGKMDTHEGLLLLLRRAGMLSAGASLETIAEAERTTAEAIVQAFDGLPLALDQAGAYIEETECSVSDYLNGYHQRQVELLERRGQTGGEYPETVATTWSLSFERVEQLSPMAADLLRACAFIPPDAIPEELFVKGASELGPGIKPLTTDATRLNDAIDVLRRYSLVKRDRQKRMLTIHRLVQVVLKERMNDQTQRQWKERTLRAINQLRRSSENYLSLPSEVISQIASEEFRHYSKAHARRSAARKGMVVFIGCGDLTKFIIDNINSSSNRTAADNSVERIITVGIDTKFTVGSSHADYFLWLDANQGLWDDEALIDLLRDLLPRRRLLQSDRKPVAQLLNQGFAPLDLVPMVIGEYHGFNVKTVFEAVEKLGYQVMPDKNTAIWAMDKGEFWQAYHTDPVFSNYLLPQEIVVIPEEFFHGKVAPHHFLEEVEQKVRSIGLPCMLKPAISEFGYGQIKLEDMADIVPAFKAVAKQCDDRKVNPGNRVVIEPFANRKVVDRLAKGRPVELLQIVLRHLKNDGKLVSTCLPPIWFVNYQPRTYGSTDLVTGPQVFDFAIQAPARALPELLSDAQYIEIQQKSIQLIETMTKSPGLFGLEIFLVGNGEFKFNRVSVRTQDTMFATLPTPQTNAFALLTKVIQNERINDSQILKQTCISGVKTIVWEEDGTGRILDFEGKKDAEQVENVCKVDIYTERRELRPLRRYGLIQVCVPIEADIGADDVKVAIDKVRISMEEARRRINIVTNLDQ
jgi:hypothetical protein